MRNPTLSSAALALQLRLAARTRTPTRTLPELATPPLTQRCRRNSWYRAPCTARNGVLFFPSASESVRDRHSQEQSGCGGETEVAAPAKRPRGLFVSAGKSSVKKVRKMLEKTFRTPLTGSCRTSYDYGLAQKAPPNEKYRCLKIECEINKGVRGNLVDLRPFRGAARD